MQALRSPALTSSDRPSVAFAFCSVRRLRRRRRPVRAIPILCALLPRLVSTVSITRFVLPRCVGAVSVAFFLYVLNPAASPLPSVLRLARGA